MDTSKRKVYWTTRRAGKTTCVLYEFIYKAISNPYSHFAFIAKKQKSAKGIVWKTLKQINREAKIGAKFQKQELTMEFPNGSLIQLYGADREDWIEDLLGHKLAGCAIDEAAHYNVDLRQIVEDVIAPTLVDIPWSQLILLSNPSENCFGLFFDICDGKELGWSLHKWTVFDNPHIKDQITKEIARLKKHNPDIESTPSFRRNWLGEWVTDFGEKIYRYQPLINTIEKNKIEKDYRYILGVDIGWYDCTGFSLLGWKKDSDIIVEIESRKEKEMPLDKIAAYMKYYVELYPNLIIVGDPAQKTTFEELRRRYQLPLNPAKKTTKETFIGLVNTDFDSGKIKIVEEDNKEHIEELHKLTWVLKNGRRVETPGISNDICDAFLYAYRECYHFIKKAEQEQEVTPDLIQKQMREKAYVEALRNKIKQGYRFW